MGKYLELLENILREEDFEQTFWGTIGTGILPICTKTKRILMAYRSKMVNEPNSWGTIGGRIDNPENLNIEEEAKREFLEETGYNKNLKLIPAYIFSNPNFKYYNFIGLLDEEFEPKTDWETEFFQWMSFDEMIAKKNDFHFGLEKLLNDPKSLKIIRTYS